MDIKTKLYVTKKIDNDLVAISKSKVALKLNKSAYFGMRKVLMHEFHYDYIKNKYGNADALLYQFKF